MEKKIPERSRSVLGRFYCTSKLQNYYLLSAQMCAAWRQKEAVAARCLCAGEPFREIRLSIQYLNFSILNADMKDVDLAAAVIVCVANWLSIKCTQHSYVSLHSAAYLEHTRLVSRTNILCQCKIWGFYVGVVEDSGLLACDCAIFMDQVSNFV